MKNILGLDLGTSSIGWALVKVDDDGKPTREIHLGSRIIPMTQEGNYDKGQTVSSTKERTTLRSARRLRQRELQRRERLFRVLHTLRMLPPHFDSAIGWNRTDNTTYGKFLDYSEPKMAWQRDDEGAMRFFFIEAYNEMLTDFRQHQPALVANDRRVPYDWTLYYLRKKALTQAVTPHELAWILLSFNQKRGYYQLRGMEEDDSNADQLKRETYMKLMVAKVEKGESLKGNTEYTITFDNGDTWVRYSKTDLGSWQGQEKEVVRTATLDEKGNEKRVSFRVPNAPDSDWKLLKTRTESQIAQSKLTVGAYIYDLLLSCPSEKIRGKLVRVVERKFYKDELQQILYTQKQYHAFLSDREQLEACIQELYHANESHKESLRRKDMANLLVEDLIFYQRPLKSKKSLIANCPYERRTYLNPETGELVPVPVKCVAKSNPYYQEFRLWQFINHLRLVTNDAQSQDVTANYLPDGARRASLYTFLSERAAITEKDIVGGFLKLKADKSTKNYPIRWNYLDKPYPGNETRAALLKALRKANVDCNLLCTNNNEYRLWHLLYSVEDSNNLRRALAKFADSHQLSDAFVDACLKVPAFKKDYGAYSEKAVKKLLSVMREGCYWHEEEVPDSVERVMDRTLDERILQRLIDKEDPDSVMTRRDEFQGLSTRQACLVVYGSEQHDSDVKRWETPQEMATYIHNFRQHSMRNPVVEQVVLECLRTVHDIWRQYGKPDEIHIELGRNMKQTAEQRARATARNAEQERTNLRIKKLLMEMQHDHSIANVRPYSPIQQNLLKIYEEGALATLRKTEKDYEMVTEVLKAKEPTSNQLMRYRLWLEQRYCSPYTGKAISLSKLFTDAYEIEHVIPQSRFFDDSFNNKVICESEVNKAKTNMLGMEFINRCAGMEIHTVAVGKVKVFYPAEYKEFVDAHYYNNREKGRRLLMEEIPQEFINRQLNDSRYISRAVMAILSSVVREEGEMEPTSKHVISCTGGITDRLKQDWGLNEVWNRLVQSRFERMNAITKSEDYGHWENKEGKRVFQTTMPLERQAGFNKKRIDHRHHAMDALTIACASRGIINYLNNQSAANPDMREAQRQEFCLKNREVAKPWSTFTQDAQQALEQIVVSFKNYVRIINKATNHYDRFDTQHGKKMKVAQQGSDLWAIRKPLHKDTVYANVDLRRQKEVKLKEALIKADRIVNRDLRLAIAEMRAQGKSDKLILQMVKNNDDVLCGIKVDKVAVYYFTNEKESERMAAVRKPLDDTFNEEKSERMAAVRKPLDVTFTKERIKSITDTGIQQILLHRLAECSDDPKVAFSPEGIAEMNARIAHYNKGKDHKPILRVRVAESLGMKHPVGETGNKTSKFVEAAKGTNLYYAIYGDGHGKRTFATIPLAKVAERLKQGMLPTPEEDGDNKLLFTLSPNELVYMPTDGEMMEDNIEVCNLDMERIYKFVSCTGKRSYFIPSKVASCIVAQTEFSSLDKIERALDGNMIKERCWKLEVDRLGNIIKIIR